MIKYVKAWLLTKYLPEWCREEMLGRNGKLEQRVDELKQENDMLRAYINGMHDAAKRRQKIIITAGGVVDGDPISGVKQQ